MQGDFDSLIDGTCEKKGIGWYFSTLPCNLYDCVLHQDAPKMHRMKGTRSSYRCQGSCYLCWAVVHEL